MGLPPLHGGLFGAGPVPTRKACMWPVFDILCTQSAGCLCRFLRLPDLWLLWQRTVEVTVPRSSRVFEATVSRGSAYRVTKFMSRHDARGRVTSWTAGSYGVMAAVTRRHTPHACLCAGNRAHLLTPWVAKWYR